MKIVFPMLLSINASDRRLLNGIQTGSDALILSSSGKTIFHRQQWANALTACAGSGSTDDVIYMALLGARILRGSNALQIVPIGIVADEQ